MSCLQNIFGLQLFVDYLQKKRTHLTVFRVNRGGKEALVLSHWNFDPEKATDISFRPLENVSACERSVDYVSFKGNPSERRAVLLPEGPTPQELMFRDANKKPVWSF